MANGTRTLTLLVVLVIGLAVGWFFGHSQPSPQTQPQPTPQPSPAPTAPPAPTPIPTPPGPYPPASNWTLTVGPGACDVTSDGKPVPVAVISKKKMHWIRFQPDAGQLLGIVFHVEKNDPKPFKNMALAGYDPQGNALWSLVCDEPGKKCFSGPAQKDARETYYKCDQILDGKVCDAGIIIQP